MRPSSDQALKAPVIANYRHNTRPLLNPPHEGATGSALSKRMCFEGIEPLRKGKL